MNCRHIQWRHMRIVWGFDIVSACHHPINFGGGHLTRVLRVGRTFFYPCVILVSWSQRLSHACYILTMRVGLSLLYLHVILRVGQSFFYPRVIAASWCEGFSHASYHFITMRVELSLLYVYVLRFANGKHIQWQRLRIVKGFDAGDA